MAHVVFAFLACTVGWKCKNALYKKKISLNFLLASWIHLLIQTPVPLAAFNFLFRLSCALIGWFFQCTFKAGLGKAGLFRDQCYPSDTDAGMPMPNCSIVDKPKKSNYARLTFFPAFWHFLVLLITCPLSKKYLHGVPTPSRELNRTLPQSKPVQYQPSYAAPLWDSFTLLSNSGPSWATLHPT
jgi:hypothetical protein